MVILFVQPKLSRLNLMWDESLPAYDGSLEHNIIVLSLYCQWVFYRITILFGILTMIALSIMPFVGLILGYKSFKIKLKQDKHHKKIKKHKERQDNINQDQYLKKLHKNLKKKKKHA